MTSSLKHMMIRLQTHLYVEDGTPLYGSSEEIQIEKRIKGCHDRNKGDTYKDVLDSALLLAIDYKGISLLLPTKDFVS